MELSSLIDENLKKGDIVFFHYKNSRKNSRVKQGGHLYVILNSYNEPLNTYLVAPITSTESNVPNSCVKLSASLYPEILDYDSYIDLRFIIPADKKYLNYCRCNDHPSRNRKYGSVISHCVELYPDDLEILDMHLILILELSNCVKDIIDVKVSQRIEKISKYLDKTHNESVKEILENMKY
ncbi:MAG: hypothetical protein Q8900_03175 [Bacillota bacterium]|nr:hypothetical protein [Bacillota bacterium]